MLALLGVCCMCKHRPSCPAQLIEVDWFLVRHSQPFQTPKPPPLSGTSTEAVAVFIFLDRLQPLVTSDPSFVRRFAPLASLSWRERRQKADGGYLWLIRDSQKADWKVCTVMCVSFCLFWLSDMTTPTLLCDPIGPSLWHHGVLCHERFRVCYVLGREAFKNASSSFYSLWG